MKKLLLLSLISIFSSHSFAEDNSSIYRGLGTGPEDFLNFQILKQKGFLAKKPNVSRVDYNDIYKLKNLMNLWDKTFCLFQMNICLNMWAVV